MKHLSDAIPVKGQGLSCVAYHTAAKSLLKQMLTTLTLFCCFLLLTPLWSKPSINVRPDTIVQDKPFRLILKDDSAQRGVPDLTPLERDFSIIGTEQSSSVTVINNQIESETTWIIHLRTDKTGQLTIPALEIDGESTDPLLVNVQKRTATSASPSTPSRVTSPAGKPHAKPTPDTPGQNDKADVILTVDTDIKKPYLNQQVIYTVRLLNARRLVDVEFQPPVSKDGLMFPLGDSQRYELTEQGKRYAVEELHYAIFPLKSGRLRIEPPQFSALIYDGFPQRVRPQADPITLAVQPVPPGSDVSTWLPAQKLSLEEEYNTYADALFKGDTLTREITIKTLGLTAELMPEYPFDGNAEFNVYTDKPVQKNYLQTGQVLGTSTLKVTYLFNKPGKIKIPAFEIQWFNTKTKTLETTELPPHEIHIKPASASPQGADAAAPTEAKEAPGTQAKNAHTPANFSIHWMYWLLLAGLILLIAGLLWRVQYSPLPLLATRRELESELRKACQQNDAARAASCFQQWARAQWPSTRILNLTDAANQTADQGVIKQTALLAKVLYDPKKSSWSGEAFWDAFRAYTKKKTKSSRTPGKALPPINPA